MSKPFTAVNRFVSGNFHPWPMEGEVIDLEVEGEIPEALCGAFFRNSSNPQFVPGPDYHWFSGDGMIHALYFENGKCHYRNRWVRTARFELERKHGERLFGGVGGTEVPDPRSEGVSGNSSNTHIIWHGGRLLSLWEAGPPYELDPDTLETVGVWDYDGAFMRERAGAVVPDNMTAHPKIDPVTGEWIAFGYSPLAPNLVYHAVDRAGKLTRSFEVDAPFPSMMHDFIVSAEHAIFPVFPAVFNFDRLAETGSFLNWEPERGTHIGVMPRNGGNDDAIWIEADARFSFHTVNARSVGSKVIAELWQMPSLALFEHDGPTGPPHLHRWTLDLEAGTLSDEALDDLPAEFGRIDERFAGGSYRHLFSLGNLGAAQGADSSGPDAFNCLFHYDLATGTRKEHRLPGTDSAGEPVFVPRSADADEGDGFVVSVVHRAAENRSDVIVLDAQNIEREPLATIRLPHAIPYCFHGSWKPAG